MILQCSECNARYVVPDSAIGADGRTVRCANCKHSWFQAGSPTAAEAEILSELDRTLDAINARPKPIPPGSNLPARRREPTPGGLKAGVLTLLAASLALAALWQKPAWLGFTPSTGMIVDALTLTRLEQEKPPSYEISGRIINTTGGESPVPSLRVTLVDENGVAQQQSWDFPGGGNMLEAGAEIPFATGKLDIYAPQATRFVVELGNSLELALRRKPE